MREELSTQGFRIARSALSDLVLIEDVLPNYVDRYASLALPMGMLFARGDRLLDYPPRVKR
jgi:hypothetical protein